MASETLNEVEEVSRLAVESHQAMDEFVRAGTAFGCIVQQIAELQEELMRIAAEMHAAKCRSDAAVASVKRKAGLI